MLRIWAMVFYWQIPRSRLSIGNLKNQEIAPKRARLRIKFGAAQDTASQAADSRGF